LRVPPAFDIEKAKKQLREIAGKALLEVQQEIPAVVAQKNTALTRAFLSAIRAQGGMPSFKKKSGTADTNVFAQYWNCPMLTYGPGNSHLDHSEKEHVEFSEIKKALLVLEGVLCVLMR
ncbi:MAG: M20/M25/M40 family metallo-hydrolase, partial [Candidatus Diapherotrites archaeon]